MARRKQRAPLDAGRLVTAARELLVEGGPDAVVVREVARRLEVTAPALYKHVRGRDDLLTLLIAECYEEVSDACQAARDAQPAGDHRGRLREATEAFRTWANANSAEFALLFGSPLPGYRAPEEGPTTASARRFGQVFFEIFAGALHDGRLRVRDDADLHPDMRRQLHGYIANTGLQMSPGEVYPFVMGWQRMLGLVAVECTGQLGWAMPDPRSLTDEQLAVLADDLLVNHPLDR